MNFRLAKEGWPFVFISGGIGLLLLYWNIYVSIPILLVTFLIINFFRDPERFSSSDSNIIIAPADGKIIAIQDSDIEGKFKKHRKISIFMNIFDVHINRMPIHGTIKKITHIKGSYLPANNPKASLSNEHVEIEIDTDYGEIMVRLVAGMIARRICCYVFENQTIMRGKRISIIKLGSRVDLYLPSNARIEVSQDTKVTAGKSPIATMIKDGA